MRRLTDDMLPWAVFIFTIFFTALFIALGQNPFQEFDLTALVASR